jgi:hypothetical protein
MTRTSPNRYGSVATTLRWCRIDECEENLALRYIRAALEGRGHSVTQITFNAEADTEAAAECLARSGAGLAGFSMVFTYRAAEFAAVARRSRELGFRGHLVAGGHFAAFNIVPTRAELASVRIKEPMVRAKTWTVRYTAAELAEAAPPTQYFEMAPRPPRTNVQPPPGTHISEMVPLPRPKR